MLACSNTCKAEERRQTDVDARKEHRRQTEGTKQLDMRLKTAKLELEIAKTQIRLFGLFLGLRVNPSNLCTLEHGFDQFVKCKEHLRN